MPEDDEERVEREEKAWTYGSLAIITLAMQLMVFWVKGFGEFYLILSIPTWPNFAICALQFFRIASPKTLRAGALVTGALVLGSMTLVVVAPYIGPQGTATVYGTVNVSSPNVYPTAVSFISNLYGTVTQATLRCSGPALPGVCFGQYQYTVTVHVARTYEISVSLSDSGNLYHLPAGSCSSSLAVGPLNGQSIEFDLSC